MCAMIQLNQNAACACMNFRFVGGAHLVRSDALQLVASELLVQNACACMVRTLSMLHPRYKQIFPRTNVIDRKALHSIVQHGLARLSFGAV